MGCLVSLTKVMTKRTMERMRKDIGRTYVELKTRRMKKAKALRQEKNIVFDYNIRQKLETVNHLENALFLVEDLVETVDSSNQEEEVIHAPEEETRGDEIQMTDIQEDENGRLTGVFVSGNVVNLSREKPLGRRSQTSSKGAEIFTHSQRY